MPICAHRKPECHARVHLKGPGQKLVHLYLLSFARLSVTHRKTGLCVSRGRHTHVQLKNDTRGQVGV